MRSGLLWAGCLVALPVIAVSAAAGAAVVGALVALWVVTG